MVCCVLLDISIPVRSIIWTVLAIYAGLKRRSFREWLDRVGLLLDAKSRSFADQNARVESMAKVDDPVLHRRRVRRANSVSVDSIFRATASKYAASAEEYVGFRNGAAGRDMAAYLCRRYTSATLRELSDRFGLNHPDSALDLIRRGAKRMLTSAQIGFSS